MSYKRTLEAFRRGLKVARREIEDDQHLARVIEKYFELEEVVLKGGNGRERPTEDK